MSKRRMFTLQIVDSDAFLDMPDTSQLLYFHLSMRADDDGFVSNPKKIMRVLGSQEDSFKILLAKRFVIPFESGVCVIKHWRMHNLIRSDRYSETPYLEEKSMLSIKENGSYKITGKPDDNQRLPQVRVGKVSLGKVSKDNISNKLDTAKPITYGNENINYLIRIFKEITGLAKLDGTDQSNRRYLMLSAKKFGGWENVEKLIRVATKSNFHKANLTSPKYIYYNGVKILSEYKTKIENPNLVKIK